MDEINEPVGGHQLYEGGLVDNLDESSQDYRLTTAEILYHVPDFPDLLQSYLWQSLDRVPDFPKLSEFLGSWEKELDGTLHSVRIGYVGIIQPTEWHFTDCMMSVH